jgi:hypothetical protein
MDYSVQDFYLFLSIAAQTVSNGIKPLFSWPRAGAGVGILIQILISPPVSESQLNFLAA